MEPTIPVFDFASPWVAVIQIVLIYLLPRLVGLISDKLAKSSWKIIALGVVTIIASGLTWLLDVALADAWATLDWTALINVLVNSALTFFLAQGVYQGILKPTGSAARDAERGVSLIPADPVKEREVAEEKRAAAAAESTIASRRQEVKEIAADTARAVVEEKLAAIPVATLSSTRTRAAAKPKAGA